MTEPCPCDRLDDSLAGGWRLRFRPGSVLLVAILVIISGGPLLLLWFAGGCTEGSVARRELRPVEKISFTTEPRVRVLLASHTRGGVTLPIRVTGPYSIVDSVHTTLVRGDRLAASPVQALSDGLVITVPDTDGRRKTMHLPRIRVVPVKSGTLQVGTRTYRGLLEIIYNRDATMTLVNDLDLEEYVGGVVTAEMFKEWPREALRAQAVCARTYTLALILEDEKMSPRPQWDLESSYQTAQEYQGVTGEHPKGLEAARSTEGLVLTYNDSVFRAYFSACCGGHTEACGLVWEDYKTLPPLAGTTCDYCARSKWMDWTAALTLSEVEKAMSRAGRDVGTVKELRFSDTNKDSHADRVTVVGSRETVTMLGNNFRLAVGSTNLKSLNFEAKRVNGSYEFTGHGWGHGVGMCQYGAKGMADVLMSHERILEYYFPGAKLWKMY